MKNQDLLIANGAGDWTPSDPGPMGGMESQIIYAANASRFTEAHFSEPLTTYAVNWRDQEGLQELLDFVAPPVEVPRKFEYNVWNNGQQFLADVTDDTRAIGADFKRVELIWSKSTAKTLNKGLTYRVDLDNVDENTNWRYTITNNLMQRVMRSEVKRAIALLLGSGVQTDAKEWTTPTDTDPDLTMLEEVVTSIGIMGIPPTNLLMDLTAWALRARAHRSQATAGGFGSAGLTVQQVAEQIGCSRGMIARHKYVSSGVYAAAANTKTSIAGGNYVFIFLAQPGTSIEDPSNIKRFVSLTQGGTRMRVYEQQVNMKTIDITVEHYSIPVITYSSGIRYITIS